MNTLKTLILLGIFTTLPACDAEDDDAPTGEGTWRFTVFGEDFIEQGIPADAFIDGWSVSFDHFYIVISGVNGDGVSLSEAKVFDLAQDSGGAGHLFAEAVAPAQTHDFVGYTVAPAASAVGANIDDSIVQALVSGGFSVQVEGSATKGDVTKNFGWRFTTATPYGPCEISQPLATGGTITSQFTIHADHLFYDDLDSSEPNVAFDLIATADANNDGTITEVELAGVDITGETRYQVGSRTEIGTLWAFIEAQTATLGHIDGEGHCEVE